MRRQVRSGVVGVDTVICPRLYGQMRLSVNVCEEQSVSGAGHGTFKGSDPAALEPSAQAETRRVETLAFLLIPAGTLKGVGVALALGAGLASFF